HSFPSRPGERGAVLALVIFRHRGHKCHSLSGLPSTTPSRTGSMAAIDAIVIGAGIAGASAAYAIAERARVVVLERESAPGYHTTGRSAATYLETYGNRVIRALTPVTGRFLDAPPPGVAEHPILIPRGALLIATEEQRGLLDRAFHEARDLDTVIERMDGETARRLVPALRPDYVAEAFLEPGARDIDVHGLHQGYLKG